MEVLDPSTWQSLKDAFSSFREAIGLAKDAKELLHEGPQKEAVTKAISQAENSAGLAEAQIAKSLGYEICRCTFPPQIMLMKRKHETRNMPISVCPKCGSQEPTEDIVRQWNDRDQEVREIVRRKRELQDKNYRFNPLNHWRR
jgi:NAD-dependent SIR2 family protein deacetylase